MKYKKMTYEEMQASSERWARERGIDGKVIGVFRTKENGFLCNFHGVDIVMDGHSFKNGESAFQAQKCLSRVGEFAEVSPDDAKKLGRQVRLRSDWETVKDQVMYDVVYAKFTGNDRLKKKLLDTGDAYLVEGNWWKDRYWGVYRGVGENRLGEILMRVRDELRN